MTSHPPLNKLRRAIRNAGYRMEFFAQTVGERPDYFSRMLAGGRPPKKDLFKRAADALKCEESELTPDDFDDEAAA